MKGGGGDFERQTRQNEHHTDQHTNRRAIGQSGLNARMIWTSGTMNFFGCIYAIEPVSPIAHQR